MVLSQITRDLKRERQRDIDSDTKGKDTDRGGGGDVTTEGEIGAMRPQVKECQQPPETGRGKEWILP